MFMFFSISEHVRQQFKVAGDLLLQSADTSDTANTATDGLFFMAKRPTLELLLEKPRHFQRPRSALSGSGPTSRASSYQA
jgi:hypothetical protein